MKRKYYLLFFKLTQFFKAISDDSWEKSKALIVINALCVLFLIELMVWWTLAFKSIVNISKFWLIIPVLIIVVLNYNFLMSNDNWNNYENQFKNLPNSKNRIINLSVIVIILLMLGSLIFAFYQMSMVDWCNYR
jgi:hypothetical protein